MLNYSKIDLEIVLKNFENFGVRPNVENFFGCLDSRFERIKIFLTKNKIQLSQLKTLLEYYFINNEFPKCEICGKEHCRFRRRELRTFCSKDCGLKVMVKNVKITSNLKYGVDVPSKSEVIKNKIKEKEIEKYNGLRWCQTDEFKEKSKKTLLENYGVDHNFKSEIIKLQREQTWLNNLGVKSPLESGEVMQKIKDGYYSKYGVYFPSQLKASLNKMLKNRFKDYSLGERIVKILGYENMALDYIIEVENISPLDILVASDLDCPSFSYVSTIDGEFHVYNPDIYIKSQNRIIEVKSTWTYEKDLNENFEKRIVCLDKGYKFNFYIMGETKLKKDQLLEII